VRQFKKFVEFAKSNGFRWAMSTNFNDDIVTIRLWRDSWDNWVEGNKSIEKVSTSAIEMMNRYLEWVGGE